MDTTTHPPKLGRPCASAAHGILDLAAELQLHLADALAELDLTEALAGAIFAFDSGHECLPRRDLALRLRCDPSNVTFLADRLEARGYIERTSDARDRRVKAMRLTPEGEAARARLQAAFAEGSPFARLSDAELTQFVALLGRLTDTSDTALAGSVDSGSGCPTPPTRAVDV